MNQAKLFFVCGACLALVSTRRAGAEPFNEAKGVMFNAPLLLSAKKEIVPPQGELPVSEAIIALSKASGVNLLADVTQIPVASRVAPFPASDLARSQKWTPTFSSVSGDMALAAQLAELSYDETTILLWKRPGATETARALLAADRLRLVQPLPDEFGVSRALTDFRKNSTGWTNPIPTNPVFVVGNFRFGDLPSTTRQTLLALARYAILRPDLKRELLLSDEFWKTARVLVAPGRDVTSGKISRTVYIGGQDANGQAMPFMRVFGEIPLQLLDENLQDAIYPAVPVGIDAPLASVAEETMPAVVGLTATQLEAEAPLQTLISLEEKRLPLDAVLADATKQSGVVLSKAADVPAILVTARVQQMPLHELMGAIGRLCGAMWQKSVKGYELAARPLEPWQKLLLQSGEGDFQSQLIPEQLQPAHDVEQAVIDEVGDTQTPQGAPFSALSDDLQTQLKQHMQDAAAFELLRAYNNAFIYAYPEGMVHLRRSLGKWNVQLLASDNIYTLAYTDVRQPPPKKDVGKTPQELETIPAPNVP